MVTNMILYILARHELLLPDLSVWSGLDVFFSCFNGFENIFEVAFGVS